MAPPEINHRSHRMYGVLALALLHCFNSQLLRGAVSMPKPTKPLWQELREQLRNTRNFRLGAPFNIKIARDAKRMLYQKAIPPSTSAAIYEFNWQTGQETKVLDAEQLASGIGSVSAEENALRERLRLLTGGINFFTTDDSAKIILTPLKGKLFAFDILSKKHREIAPGQGAIYSPKLSPDGKLVAFIRDSNLYVASVAGDSVTALTQGGHEEKPFGVAEFIAQEELARTDGFWWSPDSKTILLQAVDQSHVERLAIADPFHPNSEPQRPFYPRPGKANATFRFGFAPIQGGPITWIDFGPQPFEYVGPVQWHQNGPPSFLLLNRLQTEARLVTADPKMGSIQVLLTEKDPGWVAINNSVPKWLPHNQGFLWITDRHGPYQLELRSSTGELIRKLSPESISVRRLLGISDNGKQAFFEGTSDSPNSAIYQVSITDGHTSALTQLKNGSVTSISDFHPEFYATRDLNLQGGDLSMIRSWDNKLAQAIPSASAKPILAPNVTIEEVGPDAIRTALIRPSNFDKRRRYPVIEHAYGGPHALQVKASGMTYLEDQVLADALQAVIVRMDSRGTPDRGRLWEKAISRRFGSLPVQEHAETLKQLCAKHPELDGDRIGVFGWSYGGYFSAYAVLARPDVYKVAVAGAPPVDWLDYDTAYTERYLGIPAQDKAAYDSSSILSLLPAAQKRNDPRPLLIIHGTADDNVFFFNSLKLVDGLERLGLPYEFLPLMGMTHMVSDSVLESRRFERTLDFFKKRL